jgi:hypothetical protein
MMTITELLSDEEVPVAEAAQRAVQLKQRLDAGSITQDEYDELAQDIVNIESIKDSMDSVERQIKFQQALDIIKMFLGLLK